jgi:GNAT superfamily N-acetyltransferase
VEFTLREARLEDAAQLTDLLREVGWRPEFQTEPLEQLTQRVARQLALCHANESHTVYVAVDTEGTLVGYVAVHWLPYLMYPGPEGFISELFLREPVRGQGLGAKLLETVKQAAKARGGYRLQLINHRQRESYRRGFYAKQGWEERLDAANFVFYLD